MFFTMHLEQLQARTDGCIGGNTLLIIISCALDGLVQQFHQSAKTQKTSYI